MKSISSSKSSVSLESMTQATAEEADRLTGEVIGGMLEVGPLLGKGGMGVVYQVHHREWNRQLAMKVPLNLGDGAQFDLKRWVREAHTWIDLGLHPRIVSCWFVREWRHVPVLFLDLCSGGSLKERLERRSGPPSTSDEWAEALGWLIHASEGLSYAHQLGLAHRDIKPANLLFDSEGSLAVTDFGLSKAFKAGEAPVVTSNQGVRTELFQSSADVSLTRTGVMTGTPHYAPPEQWMQKSVGPEADIYSLGVVAYQALTGRHPFEPPGESWNLGKLISAHLSTIPESPAVHRPEIPASLAETVLACLAKQPSERPTSLAEVRTSLVQAYADMVGREYPHGIPQPLSQRADSLNNKAVSLWSIGLQTEAMQAWAEADRIERSHFEVSYNRTVTSWLMGRRSVAETEQALRELASATLQGRAALGRFLLARGGFAEAFEVLSEALQSATLAEDGALWRALGEAALQLGEQAKAREAFHKTLSLIAHDEVAQEGLDVLERGEPEAQEGLVAECSFRHLPPLKVWTVLESGLGLAFLFGEKLLLTDPRGKELLSVELPPLKRVQGMQSRGGSLLIVGSESCLVLSFRSRGKLELEGLLQWPDRAIGFIDEDRILTGETTLKVQGRKDREAFGSLLMGHEKQVLSSLALANGQTLITGGADRSVRVWNLNDSSCSSEGRGHQDFVLQMVAARQEQLLMTADRSGLLLFWLMPRLERVHKLQFPGEIVRLMVSHQDEEELLFVEYKCATEGYQTAVVLLDRFQVMSEVAGRMARWVHGLGLLHKGEFKLLSLPDGIEWRNWNIQGDRFSTLQDSPDGRQVYFWTKEQSLAVLRLPATRPEAPSLALVRANTLSEAQQARQLYASLMEKAWASHKSGEQSAAYWHLTQARLVEGYSREPETLDLLNRLAETLCRRELREMWLSRSLPPTGMDLPQRLCLDREGRWAATTSGGLVRLWDLRTGICIRGLTGHRDEVVHLAFWDSAEPGRSMPLLFSFSVDKTLRVWDTETGECLVCETVADSPIGSAQICERTRSFVLLTQSGTLKWGRWKRKRPHRLEVPDDQLELGGAGLLAMSSGARWITVTDLHTKILHRTEGLARPRLKTERPYRYCSFPTGQRHLLGVTKDNNIELFDLHDNLDVLTMSPTARQPLSNLLCSRDGSVVATLSAQNNLSFWLLELQRCVMERPLGENYQSLTFSGNGRYLAGISSGGNISIWELEWGLDPERPGAETLFERLPKLSFWGRLRKRLGI